MKQTTSLDRGGTAIVPLRLLAWGVATIWLLIGAAVLFVVFYPHQHLQITQPQTILIPPGASLRRMASILAQGHSLDHPTPLVWYGRLTGIQKRLKAGEYALAPGMTIADLLDRLTRGAVVHHRFTIVEGWTLSQVLRALQLQEPIAKQVITLDEPTLARRLHWNKPSLNGWLFPDTYLYTRGTPDVVLLQRALSAMQYHMTREWAERAPGLPYRNSDEALVMASVVEREARLPSEQPLIAGVLIRRLWLGMPLQADPTVIYGLGSDYKRPLTRQNLQQDTPFNTYLHKGLPPQPIANPGLGALHAALHPAPGTSLYFVARGDGSHDFSNTYAEHLAKVALYRCGGACPSPHQPQTNPPAP